MFAYIKPYFLHKDSMHLVYKSMAVLAGSKGLAIASPYILKVVVDSITLGGAVDLNLAVAGITIFGVARFVSTLL